MPLDAEIQARCAEFADELLELVKRSAVDAVREALANGGELGVAGPRRTSRPTARANGSQPAAPSRPSSTPPTSPAFIPLSLDHYERMAILRALAETGGHVLDAGKLMGETKSTIYRRMQILGIPRAAPEPGSFLVLDGPPTMAAYERAALERALAEAGGDIPAAAGLLGVGKSTMYRKLGRHGIG